MLAIYCRVSSVDQVDNYSLSTQKDSGIEFAHKHNLDYEVYTEQGSGGNIQRLELSRMVDSIQNGQISSVWVIELSRLSRSIEDLQFLKNLFNQHNVSLYVHGQHYDLNKTDSVTMYNLIGVFAEHERSGIRDRMVRGKKSDIDQGGRSVSKIFGYRHLYTEQGDPYWKIEESEAETIRLIYRLYLEGMTQRKLQYYLQSNRHRTMYDGQWNRPQISRILKQPLYCGMTQDTKGNWIKSTRYPAIIDIETYKAAERQRLSRNTRLSEKRWGAKLVLYNCSALLRCTLCQRGYIHKRKPLKSGGYLHYYSCQHDPDCIAEKNSWRKEQLDEIVFYCTMAILEDTESIYQIYRDKVSQLEQRQKLDREDLERLNRESKKIDKKRERLIDAIADGTLSHEDVRPKIEKLNRDKKELKDKIDLLEEKNADQRADLDFLLLKFSNEKRKELDEAYTIDQDEKKTNKIYKELISSALYLNGKLELTYTSGQKIVLDRENLPESIKIRLQGLDYFNH